MNIPISTMRQLERDLDNIHARLVDAIAKRDGRTPEDRLFFRSKEEALSLITRWHHRPIDGSGGFDALFEEYRETLAEIKAEKARIQAIRDAAAAAVAPPAPDPTVVPIELLCSRTGRRYQVRFPVEAVEVVHDPQLGMH